MRTASMAALWFCKLLVPFKTGICRSEEVHMRGKGHSFMIYKVFLILENLCSIQSIRAEYCLEMSQMILLDICRWLISTALLLCRLAQDIWYFPCSESLKLLCRGNLATSHTIWDFNRSQISFPDMVWILLRQLMCCWNWQLDRGGSIWLEL